MNHIGNYTRISIFLLHGVQPQHRSIIYASSSARAASTIVGYVYAVACFFSICTRLPHFLRPVTIASIAYVNNYDRHRQHCLEITVVAVSGQYVTWSTSGDDDGDRCNHCRHPSWRLLDLPTSRWLF